MSTENETLGRGVLSLVGMILFFLGLIVLSTYLLGWIGFGVSLLMVGGVMMAMGIKGK